MADSGSEKGVIEINERVTVKPPRKRNQNPGVRVVSGRILSPDGVTCHQCRQKTLDFVAFCTNVRNGKKCTLKYCHKCLLNRYGENAEEVVALGNWCCAKCREICNCSFCMKKKGCKPTGLLAKTAKAKGFTSVSEMLIKGVDPLNGESVCAPAEKQGKGKRKTKREGLEDMHENIESGSRGSKKSKKIKMSNTTNDDVPNDENVTVREQDFVEDANMEIDSNVLDYRKEDLYDDFPLPSGSELQNVCGIDVREEHVGNALQFLEFCAAFGEILEVKKGQPELILQELLHGKTGRPGKLSLTTQFHIGMLSILQTDLGEEDSTEKEAWFLTLKEYLSESQSVLTQNGLDCLEKTNDYEALDASQKLVLLNVLCDEVIGTAKLRNWMDEQTEKHAEKVKDAKKEVLARKDEEKSLKKKMRDDIAKAIIANHSGAMTVSQHDAIVSRIKAEVAVAHAKVLESKGIVIKNNQTSDAVRTEPFYIADCGKAYWKLNSLGKSDVLHQDIGQGDSLSLNEKWFALDDEGKEAVDKHISVLKEKKL